MSRNEAARGRAFEWKRLPSIVLLSGGAIFLGWLAIKAAAVESFASKSPAAAAQISPDDPRVALSLAMFEFRTNAGAIRPATAQAVRRAAERAPLAEEPFLLGALPALLRNDGQTAQALLVAARQRSPRSRAPRLLLLDRYLRTGQVEKAATEITVLSRLLPEARQALIPELAKFAKEASTRPALGRVLGRDPEMREAVLTQLAADTANTDLVLNLAGRAGAARPGEAHPWQATLINSLIAKGEVQRAFRLWQRFAGISAGPAIKSVYDGSFKGLPGQPPFNWQFVASAAGVAEKGRAPAMQVEYYGRQAATLATQLLILPPGRYRLAFRAEGDADGEGSRVAWKIECVPDNAEIADLPLVAISYAPKTIAKDFTVPGQGCSAQRLRLVGVPAEFPKAQSVTITDVQVRNAGRP